MLSWEQSVNWRIEQRRRPEWTINIVWEESDENHRGNHMSGSWAYVCGNTAEICKVRHHGIPKGKEQSDDLWPACKSLKCQCKPMALPVVLTFSPCRHVDRLKTDSSDPTPVFKKFTGSASVPPQPVRRLQPNFTDFGQPYSIRFAAVYSSIISLFFSYIEWYD